MATHWRLRLACLACSAGLLLVGGCTGGGDSGKPTSVDACGLLTAEQLDAVLAAREPESDGRLVATRRYAAVTTARAGKSAPTDVCEFTQVRERGNVERALEVRVMTGVPDGDSDADQGDRIDDLGDDAYFSGDANGSTLVARRGHLRLVVELATAGRRIQPSPPAPLVTAARQALDRLPEDATVPGLIAGGPCAMVDRAAVAAALDGRPIYSRSRSSGDQDSCFFTDDLSGRAALTLTKRPDGRKATAIQRRAKRVDAPGVEAYWYLGEVLVYGNGQLLSIRAPAHVPVPDAELTPGLTRLTGAAAEAYGMRQTAPSPTPSEGTDPCSLLIPEQAGRLDLSTREPTPLHVTSRAVWSYGDGVAVDTCGYERYGTFAGERPDLEVGISARHYDPVAQDDRFPKDPQPLDEFVDRAYFVHDSDEGWLVVERGQAQLTLHGRLSYQDDPATVRIRYARAAHEALSRLPDDVEIPGAVTDPACAEVASAVARAVGGELRYTRGVASEFAALCTYTMATGLAVQVGVERGLTAADLTKEREHATWFEAPGIDAGHSDLWSRQGDLIKVFGDRSMLTLTVHEPGKRAFPSDVRPNDVALARAAEPLLE